MQGCVLSIVPRGYLPELAGGLEICAMETLEFFVEQGYSGAVAAKCPQTFRGKLAARLSRKFKGPFSTIHTVKRHQVYTDYWHPNALGSLFDKLKPDFVVCHVSMCADLLQKLIALNYPTLFYIHSREISPLFGTLPADHKFAFACESTFIKKQFQQISEAHIDVIRPILPPQKFQVSDTGDAILVINPHPKKGGKLIVEAARQLPHRRFLIVGGWANTQHDPEVVEIEQALTQLPNVTRQPHVEDMRTVFKQAHCLLMPCVVAEAYGRTAAEALIAGIPVVASNQGALPETVGDGGIIIDIEAPVTEWTTHLENLFNNSDLYRNLKQQALATSQQDVRQATFIQQQLLDHAKRLSGK